MGVAYEEVLRLRLEAMSFLGSLVKREITKSALSQARSRLSWQVMERLVDECLRLQGGSDPNLPTFQAAPMCIV